MRAGCLPPKSLLLIDDSRDYCALVERAFHQVHPGLAVFPLSDGQRAIEHLALCGTRYPLPDLVLLDRSMPGGPDGYQVLRAVRSLPALNALRVLMVSGSDEDAHVAAAREAGADGYIVKPPVQAEYPRLASEVLGWWGGAESWRGCGGTLSGRELSVGGERLSSVAMTPHSAGQTGPTGQIIDIPAASAGESAFLSAFHAVRELVLKTLDPVDYAISEACRRRNIPVSHARGRSQDQVTVANRHAVICDLFDAGWSDLMVEQNFQVSKRGIERLRSDWRKRKSGGLLTGGRR